MMAGNLKRYGWIVLIVAGVVGANHAADLAAAAPAPGFWPDLNWPTTCWFAVVALLALTIRLKPLLSIRNLDALVLATMCLLLALRDAPGGPAGSVHPWQSWAYFGLTLSAVYWVLRALVLIAARRPVRQVGAISGNVRLVLLAAGLALCIHKLATAPLAPASRDGIVGGLCTSATGKLPYGDAPGFDGRSPLLYLVHAGAVRLVPPGLVPEGQAFPKRMTWHDRDWWLAQPWAESAHLGAARLVNAAFFILILLGLYLIGRRLQAEGAGWIMVTLFCLFAGTLECLPQPDIMLPTLLLTWTIAFALLPGVGGFLALLGIVLAGVAWPWAWLGPWLMISGLPEAGTGLTPERSGRKHCRPGKGGAPPRRSLLWRRFFPPFAWTTRTHRPWLLSASCCALRFSTGRFGKRAAPTAALRFTARRTAGSALPPTGIPTFGPRWRSMTGP
jgi:hypothetical protein